MEQFDLIAYDDFMQSAALAIGINMSDAYHLVASQEQVGEFAKNIPASRIVMLSVIPDIDNEGPDRDNITEQITAAFFFLKKVDMKDRRSFRPAMAESLQKAQAFKQHLLDFSGQASCSFVTNAELQNAQLIPEYNLHGLSGWFLSFPIPI